MNEKKHLNEEAYQKTNKKIKIAGIILLAIGLILAITSIFVMTSKTSTTNLNEINTTINATTMSIPNQTQPFKDTETRALGGIMLVFGFALMGFGGCLLFLSHRREILAYSAQQAMPVAKEAIEELTPTIKKAAKDASKDTENNNQE